MSTASASLPQRKPAIPNGVLAMSIFIFTEVMLFSGFISAFSIVKAGASEWPPLDQPRLPVEITAINTAVLLLSGVLLIFCQRKFKRDGAHAAKHLFLASTALALTFVAIQGYEWSKLLHYGLTMRSSHYGSYFYLIIGAHAIHAVIAILFLLKLCPSFIKGQVKKESFYTLQTFWYFVVGVWPFLYAVVYF